MKDGEPVMEDVESETEIDSETGKLKIEKVQRFESHGTYKVLLNDLTYYKDFDGNLHGEKGLSVLEP